MSMNAEQFLQRLATATPENIPHVIAAVGAESFYQVRLREELPDRIFPDIAPDDRSITVFSENVKLAELEVAINTYPFFSGSNFIVLDRLKVLASSDRKEAGEAKKKEQEALLKVLQDVPEYTYVLVICEKLDKRMKFYTTLDRTQAVVSCEPIKPYGLKPWLEGQAALYGARFDYRAVALISEYMSINDTVPLLLLRQEIEKLASYTGQRRQWTADDVAAIFADLPEASFYAVANAVRERRLQKFLELLALERRRGTNISRVCPMICSELRRLAGYKELAAEGRSQAEIVAALKVHPYVGKLLGEAERRFTLAGLRRALLDIDRMNMDLRSGGRGYERLEEIIVQLLDKSR